MRSEQFFRSKLKETVSCEQIMSKYKYPSIDLLEVKYIEAMKCVSHHSKLVNITWMFTSFRGGIVSHMMHL